METVTESEPTLRVLRDRVLIETVPPATKIGRFYVPDSAQKTNASEGTVRAVGPEVKDIAIGDRVLFEPMSMTELSTMKQASGSRMVAIPEENVLAVIEPVDPTAPSA